MTNQQLDQLFAFTQKKGVRYYDLQVELVDHLAERIKGEMEQNPAYEFVAYFIPAVLIAGIFWCYRI